MNLWTGNVYGQLCVLWQNEGRSNQRAFDDSLIGPLSLREFRKKSSKTCARNCGRKQQQKRRKVRKDAELARNSRQKIADLGQITKFVVMLRIVINFAYCANNLRTG